MSEFYITTKIIIDDVDFEFLVNGYWIIDENGFIVDSKSGKYLHKIIASRMGIRVNDFTSSYGCKHISGDKFNNKRSNLFESNK